MWIKLETLRAQGVEFDFDKEKGVISFQADRWTKRQIDDFQRMAKSLNLTDREMDEASCFLDDLTMIRAIRQASVGTW